MVDGAQRACRGGPTGAERSCRAGWLPARRRGGQRQRPRGGYGGGGHAAALLLGRLVEGNLRADSRNSAAGRGSGAGSRRALDERLAAADRAYLPGYWALCADAALDRGRFHALLYFLPGI